MKQAPPLQCGKNLSRLIKQYFLESHQQASEGKFVVWVAIGVPIEVLKGFDVVVVVPENHAAVCGARKAGAAQAAKAEARGYSPDLCSYARIDLGTVFDHGNGSPTMGLPRPNLIISDTNNCSLLVKWFDVHHRMLDVPHVVLDVPFCYAPQKRRTLIIFSHNIMILSVLWKS